MRSCLLPLAAFAAVCASATPEDNLQSAYVSLGAKPSVALQLTGYEGSHPIAVQSFWSYSVAGPQPLAQTSVASYRDNALVGLAVGDGVSLWRQATRDNTYSAATYGAYNGRQPTNYVSSLLQSLVAGSHGQEIFANQLLRDIYAGAQPTYKPWMPGVAPQEYADPYQHWISYTSPTRTLIYWLDPASGELVKVDYQSTDPNQPAQWTMQVVSYGAVQSGWNFGFVPAPGARPVSRPSGG